MLDKYGQYKEFSVGAVTQRLRWIPPGTFMMGSPELEPGHTYDESPVHQVILSRGLWMFDTACTQALWKAVMGENPSQFKGKNRPVENVSWDDAQRFIERLNELVSGGGFRLPTEAEWEYACRAGTTTPFSFGDNITTEQVNYNGNYPYTGGQKEECRKQTVDVTALPCNGWGLYQMHGNVWEWCQDWHDAYPSATAIDPVGPEKGTWRVARGGCWANVSSLIRAAYRGTLYPGDYHVSGILGFRCVQVKL